MKVLMIGIDPTLAIRGIEDTEKRHIIYGKYLEKLLIVVKVHKKVKIKKLSENVYVYPVFAKNPISFVLKAYIISRNICKREEVDVVTTQDPFLPGLVGYVIKKRFRIPFIVQLHGDFLDNKHWLNEKISNRMLNLIAKFLIKKADGVRVVSRRINERMNRINAKCFNIPIYPDLRRFLESMSNEEGKTVLFVGRLSPEKNLPTLIKAMTIVVKKHPDSSLIIVGNGKERKNLEELVFKLKLNNNVKFVGAVRVENVAKKYYSCKVFVLPSYHEGWGRAILEALACGKPVIMTDVGCAGEVVVDGLNGFIVPSESETLAEKIIYLLDNPKIAKKMGIKGRKIVMGYEIEKTATMLADMYENVVRKVRS